MGGGNPIAPALRSLRVINLGKLLEFKIDFSPIVDEGLFKSGEAKAPHPPNDWDCGEFALIPQSCVKLQNAKEDKTMLRNVTHLKGFAIRATDGEIGTVDQFYFDDESWAIRYLVVNTGGWLSGRLVLVSPIALRQAEWQSKRLDVALTKKQIEDSPPSIRTSLSHGSTRPCTWGISVTPIIGLSPFYGVLRPTRQAWRLKGKR